ncbi:hypothetical protein LOY54_08540 [Pseudomonas sp. B21-032]|uniref:hypothetical protein n=1 Tax=Pseudomonas sp. B21-032 TaxID=2895483 RepID=UPI00215F1E56|nr:hypothetical protein [Pseudomonas sp. B21-032]UVL63299.1 hypothetical protein LOY54_08540 [Pseudomonas sp. B21-032]
MNIKIKTKQVGARFISGLVPLLRQHGFANICFRRYVSAGAARNFATSGPRKAWAGNTLRYVPAPMARTYLKSISAISTCGLST